MAEKEKPASLPAASVKAASQAPPRRPKKVKVVAVQDGYYDNVLRRAGDVFFIDGTLPTPEQIDRKDGSKRDPTMPLMLGKWMRLAPADAPVHTTTSSNEVIRRDNAATAAQRAEGGTVPPANFEDDPLGAGGD